MSDPMSHRIVDVVRDILDPATERLLEGEIAGKPVVDEIRLRDEFGNVAGPDAGRLPD
jgi:hypothetical protein